MIGFLLCSALPLALGSGLQAQVPQPGEVQGDPLTESSHSSALVGHVVDSAGQPIAGAKVRVVIPSADLRFAVDKNEHREFRVETDPTGSYFIEVNGIDKECMASVDILHPGHRRLVGTLMSGETPNNVKLSPGGHTEFNAQLPEAMYFAGRVVDQSNQPIEGVSVLSSLNTPTSSAGVEQSVTDSDGRFAVYCYESRMFEDEGFLNRGRTTAILRFEHDRYIDVVPVHASRTTRRRRVGDLTATPVIGCSELISSWRRIQVRVLARTPYGIFSRAISASMSSPS